MSDEVRGLAIIPPEAEQMVALATEYAGSIVSITIGDDEQYAAAGNTFKELSGHIKAIEEERERIKRPHIDIGRSIDAYFKPPSNALANAKQCLNQALLAYQRKKAEERAKEQARLQAIADEERRKALALAAKEAEKARAYEEQGRADMAEKAAQREADALLRAETTIAPVVQAVEPPKIAGLSSRKVFKGIITDPDAFIRWAVEAGRWELIQPNEKAFGNYAKSFNKESTVPGGRIFCQETTVGVRS
jgi:hypothetical protein